MPKYVLTYFNIRGRAELARMLFAAAGVDFEDERITGEEFAKRKDKLPNGQLPVLSIDGEVFSQSMAIAKYIARKYGLAGGDGGSLDSLKADMIVDSCTDLFDTVVKVHFEKDEEKKKTEQKKFAEETVPNFLKRMSKFLEGRDYFVGKSLTIADLAVHEIITILSSQQPKLLDEYKSLKKNRDLVEVQKNIGEYLAKRTKSDM